MRVDRIPLRVIYVAATAVILALAGCNKQQTAPPPQTPQVGVVTVEPQSVAVNTELPGRTSPYAVAEVRARVDGIVLRREFVEGTDVKAGQRLFKIDPAPYEAALASARATLARAQANVAATTAQANRYKVLVAANAVSKQDYDNAVASQGQSLADVASGRAAVRTAQINLGYTDVLSPLTGRIGKAQVTQGAYVQASAATLMATVQQVDPMYVDLTQSSTDVLRLRREMREGKLQVAGPNEARVSLVLEDGSVYSLPGKLLFSDITVDPGTGSVSVRAMFPNPRHELLPGMFVRARIREGMDDRTLLVPEVGVTHDQRGQPTAMVVGPDNKVRLRTLVTTRTRGDQWIVSSGLEAGDRVVVQGVQKVQPGMTVHPVAAQLPQAATPYQPASQAQIETVEPGASSRAQANAPESGSPSVSSGAPGRTGQSGGVAEATPQAASSAHAQ